eukprot:4674090-Pleurochrysis_carterae.AAC.1
MTLRARRRGSDGVEDLGSGAGDATGWDERRAKSGWSSRWGETKRGLEDGEYALHDEEIVVRTGGADAVV